MRSVKMDAVFEVALDGGTPKWMAYKFTKVIMENPIEMDDLVAPPFMETPKLQTWIIPWINHWNH